MTVPLVQGNLVPAQERARKRQVSEGTKKRLPRRSSSEMSCFQPRVLEALWRSSILRTNAETMKVKAPAAHVVVSRY